MGLRPSIIVAATEKGIIGKDGDMPWKLSNDLQRFKRLTMGHYVIIGRKTFESIKDPLVGRMSVVLTREQDYRGSKLFAHSIQEALDIVRSDVEPFIAGGAEIYKATWNLAGRIYCTWVLADIDGDRSIPKFPIDDWKLVSSEEFAVDEKNQYPTRFCIYDRV